METKFNFNYVIQRWKDYRSWFLFSKDGVASCRLCIYDCNPKEGIISDLFVKDTFRNQGYATALLNFCNKIAKADGCNSVSLRSDNDDWIRQWYKRMVLKWNQAKCGLKRVFNMTRKEEILRKAMNSYPDCPERGFGTGDYEYPEFHDDEREAFIEGAQWADKTMIEKACEWIQKEVLEDYEGVIWSDIVKDFRKAMEEQI